MATLATAVWRVRRGGSASNGGGYDSGISGAATDYSKQDAAQATGTATSATTTLMATTGIFTAAMIGNAVTNGATWAWIVGFTSSTIVTLDSSPGWTAQAISVGGAFARPDTVLGTTPLAVAGNIVYIRNDGTAFTSTTTNTIGADGGASGQIWIVGHDTTNDGVVFVDIAESAMPIFTSATNSIAIFTLNAATSLTFRNIKTTHTAATAANRGSGWVGLTATSADITWWNCVSGNSDGTNGTLIAWNLGATAGTSITPARLIGCTARGCTSTTGGAIEANISSSMLTLIGCDSHDNACSGYSFGTAAITFGSLHMIDCIADTNTLDGLTVTITTGTHTGQIIIKNCDFYKNGGDGIHVKTTTGVTRGAIENCVFTENTGYGIEGDTTAFNDNILQINNAFYSNTAGNRHNIAAQQGDITLTSSPYTDAPNRDFTLNSTASAGASCRSGGYPSRVGISDDTTKTYIDVGASQVRLGRSIGIQTGGGL